jgi:hypothetical protein
MARSRGLGDVYKRQLPKHCKEPGPKRNSVIRMTIMINLAIFSFIGYQIYNSIHYPPHYKLTEDEDMNYRQHKQPSAIELQKGKEILKHWKKASNDDRCKMVDDLLVSRLLYGMTQQEVIEALGPPSEPAIDYPYYCLSVGEGGCELLFELKDNRVSDVYLSVAP